MASNVSVSTVARLVVPHKVPIRASSFDLVPTAALVHVACVLCSLCPCALIHVKVGKGS